MDDVDDEDEEEDDDDEEDEEADEENEGSNRPGFVKHWGWYYTLDNLSNNDRTKWEYFLEMNVIEFLNSLSYFKDKQNYIKEQLDQQMKNAR